ncbi:hypothetical protein [Rhodovulum euryhalinum]|uniref:Uncharacterized protein n=1 Tax=Rhodovulum euryhalinum TaxID=35805 RepID=A0A4R2KKP3_9RHOB|nr:hypothetical protein [Rhodovulum euryhalinum]TCO71239.1 hypothetical protein EV655_107132 [Rhodovulum euryhalinum]
MQKTAERKLSPKEAVDAAFTFFRDLYSERNLHHLLLEGVRYDEQDNCWVVTIGFDIGREKTAGGELYFLQKSREPIREFRVVRLKADDGTFLALENV